MIFDEVKAILELVDKFNEKRQHEVKSTPPVDPLAWYIKRLVQN